MKSRTGQILAHATGCIIFLTLPFLFSPDNRFSDFWQNPFSIRETLRSLLLIGFFYLNYFVLVPRLFFTKRYWGYVVAILLCFFVIAWLPVIMVQQQPVPPYPEGVMNKPPVSPFRARHRFGFDAPPRFALDIRLNIFPFFAVLFFSLMLRITGRWKQTEKEKLSTELSYLRAQVNPHFLFNTLNSIYALAVNKSDDTATAVVKLSGMMRYVLTDATNDFVSLEKEIGYISDFIELQKLRFGKNVPVHFSIHGETKGLRIAPLILIAFVENAFKYGVNAEEDMFINIEAEINEHTLHLKVLNHKVAQQHTMEDRNGVGIANTRNRLHLIYPSKHELIINETEKKFSVFLILNLQ
jgi:hypothetical protein